MKSKKLLHGLIFCLFAIETTIHFSINSIQANALSNKKSLVANTQIYKEGSVKQPSPNYNVPQKKEDYQEFNEALASLNVIKALIIISGCVFTAIVSLMGETLLKTIINQLKDIMLEIMNNQKYFENISAEEILKITQEMKQTRKDINATRLSMFRLYKESHTVFLEACSNGKYSLSNSPPIARQFFDSAILPMINNHEEYSYCGDHGDICATWLASRGTGRYAIHLFFYKDDFAGFVLAEWKRLILIDFIFKFNQNTDYYKSKLKVLADMISVAIKDKKQEGCK